MKVPLPKGQYVKTIEVNDNGLEVTFAKRKKIALLFVSINERYWPYLTQVLEDCRKNFLPQHEVKCFAWTDMPETQLKDVIVTSVEPIEWPAPTLMRYHLFLQKEEELKDFDYIFYLDADMRVVQKISDEVLGEGLTAAPHPGYALNSRLLPPYEPNKESEAFIHRLGYIGTDERGSKRFIPFYAAGGFQGGKAELFIKAMKEMKANIDKDFNRNYTAIWNDESHWNKYLWEYQKGKGDITFLDVSYIYPDSLIKEYYEPLWGRKFEPKIITLTKPFSLSKEAGRELNKMLGRPEAPPVERFECPTCHDYFEVPGMRVQKVVVCPGSGKAHQLDMKAI